MYIRKDLKIIIAEIKYYDESIPTKVASEVREKVRLFLEHNPKFKNYTIETLLIVNDKTNVTNHLREQFDSILSVDEVF